MCYYSVGFSIENLPAARVDGVKLLAQQAGAIKMREDKFCDNDRLLLLDFATSEDAIAFSEAAKAGK